MNEQMNIFECLYPTYQITKPIRLIELFAGYGSQALALKYLGAQFEHWKICEWNYKSFQAYKAIHMTDDNTDYSAGLSKNELTEYLARKGISSNWNEPMSAKQIERMGEDKLREIYNNIIATHNLVDVSSAHAEDLEITEQDKYAYVLTYSFPCQDLSLAGLRQGMDRESGTRSSLLYQVERILHECKDRNTMPDVLIMENVVQVHGTDNTENWRGWLTELEKLGYQSYWQDMIATDYGIPQIRNRTFCVSIRGDYAYNFPAPIMLEKRLKDVLEIAVSEKYYVSNKGITGLVRSKDNGGHSATVLTEQEEDCKTIDTKVGDQTHWSQYIAEKEKKPKNFSKALFETLQTNKVPNKEASFIDSYNRAIRKDDNAGTITAHVNQNTSYLATYINIPSANSDGYMKTTEGDGVSLTCNRKNHRGTVQKEQAHTLTAVPQEGVVVMEDRGNYYQWHEEGKHEILTRTYKEEFYGPTMVCNGISKVALQEGAIKLGNYLPSGHSSGKILQDDDNYPTLRAEAHGTMPAVREENQEPTLRIRKLTPRECFRLQGVRDDDIDKLNNMSDSIKYHLAGDSICTTVLMALFGQLCGIEWQEKVRGLHGSR